MDMEKKILYYKNFDEYDRDWMDEDHKDKKILFYITTIDRFLISENKLTQNIHGINLLKRKKYDD